MMQYAIGQTPKMFNRDRNYRVPVYNAGYNGQSGNYSPIASPLSHSSMDSGFSGFMELSDSSPTQMGMMSHQSLASANNNNAEINHTLQNYDYDTSGFQAPMSNVYNQQTFSTLDFMTLVPAQSTAATVPTLSPKPHIVPGNQQPPFLHIVEQPQNKPFRFRYYSEMHGTHGSLMGAQTKRAGKTFPSVALRNFPVTSKAMIRCSLYQVNDDGSPKTVPHSHKLVKRANDRDKSDPHYTEVSIENDFTAVFDGLGIIHTAKKNIKEELFKKILAEREFEENRKLTTSEQQAIRRDIEKEHKEINLNRVCLCWQAFIKNDAENQWVKICPPVYSTVINNMKSALTGELRITRMSTCTSPASGGQEVFMFVEKVCKNNIKVRFFEYFDDGAGGKGYWEAFGVFQESDVHHQYGIVLKTPPYRNTTIGSYVDVKVQLYRPKDEVTSEPLDFRYKPNAMQGTKRRRTESSDFIPTVVGSHESSSRDNTSSAFGGSRQGSLDTFGPKFNRGGHQQTYQEEESLYLDDSLLKAFNTFPLSPEDVSDIEDLFARHNFVEHQKLEVDAVCSRPPTIRSRSHEMNFSVLDKLKMLIKLFKNNFDDEKLRDMMRVLIDTQEETGGNILLDCIAQGTKEDIKDLVLILMKYKLMDVLQSVNDLDRNCFHLLILAGYPNLLKVFMNLGADVNQVDAFGQTPLHLAVTQNDQESVNEFLSGSTGTKLNEHTDDGQTALHIAAENDNLSIVKSLVEAGADVTKQNPASGDNALHVALSRKEPSLQTIAYLIDCSEQLLHQENHSEKNAYQLASGRNLNKEIMEYLASFYDEAYTTTYQEEDEEEAASGFDEICLNELCSILDKNQKWKEVATLLDLDEESGEWESDESPTRSLFLHLEQTKKSLDSVIDVLDSLEEKRALSVIDAMVARKYDNF